jgi:hypothetical protein
MEQRTNEHTSRRPHSEASPAKGKNTLGLIAFIVAIVGFIFARIPGALIVGWNLLPIAFFLELVALFFKGSSKKLTLTGLIISVVGIFVGAIVYTAVVASVFGSAITQGDWTVTINSVNLDATDELLADNMLNDAPDAGSLYILVNMTAAYNGTNPDGESVWATCELHHRRWEHHRRHFEVSFGTRTIRKPLYPL